MSSSLPHLSDSAAGAWPVGLQKSIGLDEAGFMMGAGTSLVRRDPTTRQLALKGDRDRCLALLSVVVRRPVDPGILDHLEAAATHWQRGDKALANLRLIFSGLPKLDDPADAWRLRASEYLLDEGMAPRALMKNSASMRLRSISGSTIWTSPAYRREAGARAGGGRMIGKKVAPWKARALRPTERGLNPPHRRTTRKD